MVLNRFVSFWGGVARISVLAVLGIILSFSLLASPAEDGSSYPSVSNEACPAELLSAQTADGHQAAAVLRKPPGTGPFPAIVFLHGGLNQRNVDRVRREVLRQPTNCRFLAAGYVTVEAIFRSRNEDPQSESALLDCQAVLEQVRSRPDVDPKSLVVLGHSGGGSLALELAGTSPLAAIAAGEPASIIFTGMYNKQTRRRTQRDALMDNPIAYYTPELQKFTRQKIEKIACPVLIVHGDQHPINKINHQIIIPELKKAGKQLQVIAYPGQPHTFVFGQEGSPQAVLKCFQDMSAFFFNVLPTKPAPLDKSLVRDVPFEPSSRDDKAKNL